MANKENVTLWYFIGFSKDGSVIYTNHDVLACGDDGRSQAESHAKECFNYGTFIEGQHVEFHRFVAHSENGETALDITNASYHLCRIGDS